MAARSSLAGTVCTMARSYDDSADSLLRPVEVHELEEIIANGGRPVVKNPGLLEHLLTRTVNTLSAAEHAVRSMQRQLEQRSQQVARIGVPTTLNPLDAVRYLDDEQKELIFDRITRERLQMLRSLVARAEAEQRVLDEQMSLVRMVARGLSEQVDLPAHVRAEVTRALSTLPLQPAAVHHPALLDYPDPAPLPRVELAQPASSGPTAAGVDIPASPGPGRPTFVDPYASEPQRNSAFVDPYAARTAPPTSNRS